MRVGTDPAKTQIRIHVRRTSESTPMALVLTEEQTLLREQRARGLISDQGAGGAFAAVARCQRTRRGLFPRPLEDLLRKWDFPGLLVPEDFGGSGLGLRRGWYRDGRDRPATLMPSPFSSRPSVGLAASALVARRRRRAAQKSEYLPKISAGCACLRHWQIDEGAKHRPAADEDAGRSLRKMVSRLSGDKALCGRRPTPPVS